MQLEFFEIPSPCIGICEMDEKGYCQGCMRTRDERLQWLQFTSIEKQKVIRRCVSRKKKRTEAKIHHSNNDDNTVDMLNDIPMQGSLLEQPSKTSKVSSSDIDFSDFEL